MDDETFNYFVAADKMHSSLLFKNRENSISNKLSACMTILCTTVRILLCNSILFKSMMMKLEFPMKQATALCPTNGFIITV